MAATRDVGDMRQLGDEATAATSAAPNEDPSDVLRPGHVFSVLADPEDTWDAILDEVRAALAARGHMALNIRSIHRVDTNDKTSRWKRKQFACKSSGHTHTKKTEHVGKKRKSFSGKPPFPPTVLPSTASGQTNCPFKLTVAWPRTGPPYVTQADLVHNKECMAELKLAARGDCVETDVVQRECGEDIRTWTLAGLPYADMFKMVQARYAPLNLAEGGRQKVRNLAAKFKRELAAAERFNRMEMAGGAAGLADCSAAEYIISGEHCLGDTDGATAKISSPDVIVQDKLLNDLKGIAGKEAARLCSNLSSRLTPEMAMAVFQGLTLQVDALLTGSGVVAAPALNGDLTHIKGVFARQAHLAVDADALVPGFFLMADRRTIENFVPRPSSVSKHPTFSNGTDGEHPAGGASARSAPGPSRSTTGNTPCSRSSRTVPVSDRVGPQQLRQQEMQAPQGGDHPFRRGVGTPQKEPAGLLNSCRLAQDCRVQHDVGGARQRCQAFSAPGVAGAAANVRENSQHRALSEGNSAVRSMAVVDNPSMRVGDGVQPPSGPEAARSPRGAVAGTPGPQGSIAGSPRAISSEEHRMEACSARLCVGNVNAGLALTMNGAEGGQAVGVVDAFIKGVGGVTSDPASARQSSISPNASRNIVESAAVGAGLQAGNPSEGANKPNGCVSGAGVATGAAPAASGPA